MGETGRIRAYSPVFGLFRCLRAHFLYFEDNGEEGKVHCDLVFSGLGFFGVAELGSLWFSVLLFFSVFSRLWGTLSFGFFLMICSVFGE